MSDKTITERLQGKFDTLTRAERQLADAILKDYPASGLGTITTIAQMAEVSTPTVVRLVQKLGFSGFPDFQSSLHVELKEQISNPISKRDIWLERAPDAHIINRFTDAVIGNIRQTLSQIDIQDFENCCTLLTAPDKAVYVVGGRITRTLADYFFLHLQVVRDNVHYIASNSNAWPHYLLDVRKGDTIVIFDVRRYENSTLRLAEMAAEKEAKIILFTDQWRSPVDRFADICFTNRIVVPSAWDSNVTIMLLMEIIIAEVQEKNWNVTRGRMEVLEDMFDRTRLFRKFS